jgi:hypothetical protein
MRALASILVLAFLATGCLGQDEEYVGDQGYYAFAMTETTPAYAMSEEVTLYLVELTATAPAPYPRQPWVELGDLALEVDLSVKNLMDEPREITVQINGFNEFHEYVPTVEIVDEEAIPQFSQWERTIIIEPGETFQWTVDERQLDEVAVDLATVVNGAPNPQQVVHFESQSGMDPRSDAYIPEVIPGLTGFRFGLMATGASNIVLEASLRVRDVGKKLEVDEDEEPWVLPVPAQFMPAGMYMAP